MKDVVLIMEYDEDVIIVLGVVLIMEYDPVY